MGKSKMTQETKKTVSGISRREFVASGAAAAASVLFTKPGPAGGAEAGAKINLGLVGCGDRGTWIAKLFAENGGYKVAACADYFEDRAKSFGEELGVPENKRFTGLSGYKKLLEEKLDAVAVLSPPYFHPEHAAAVVGSGRHVYIAKPVAVDVPGCNTIAQLGKDATAKKLCMLVDFQTRTDKFFMEAIKKVHEGAIGNFAFGEASFHCHTLPTQTEPDGSAEARLRNWLFDKALSGDIITEQDIHSIDVASWVMNKEPLYAMGAGGRKVRVNVGDCWDYFLVTFQYPDNVAIRFLGKQFDAYGTSGSIENRMFGSDGVLETSYGGNVMIRGKNFYRGGSSPEIYQEGAVSNIATFRKNITEGKFENPTVEPSVRSNLLTILGRTAAYKGEKILWQDILKSTEKLDGKLDGLKQ
jgi:myo-inositol 2-dehydrogenase / D-chiro-inositol 1-dehydrogenase